MSSRQTKINLIENGIHSLYKGIAKLDNYRNEGNNKYYLKDSIISIHHSIELLMKQILIEENELLIFDNLTKYHDQFKKAKSQNIDIFSLQKPPFTISYDEAVARVKSFKSPRILNEQLVEKLKELNQLRNRIEHYEIEMDKEIVETLIAYIIKPIIDLFSSHIQDFSHYKDRMKSELPMLFESYNNISEKIFEPKISRIHQIENNLKELIISFNKQPIQNKPFVNFSNLEKVPEYTSLIEERSGDENYQFDFSFISDSIIWGIELKVNPSYNTLINSIDRFNMILQKCSKIKIWLLLVFDLSDKSSNAATLLSRKQDSKLIPKRLYITSITDWEQFVEYINL